MNIITIDFESYWSSTYSLSKLSPLEYVMGTEFELISCAIKVNDGPTVVHFGHANVARAFAELDIENSALLAHNMLGFDAYICAYRLGLKPRFWLDTAAMARPLHAKTIGVSLAKLVDHYGLGTKNQAVLLATKGKHLADFTPAELADMAVYNAADTDQCYALFQQLKVKTPAAELWQIDMNVRMRTEPVFVLDQPLLEETLVIEKANKRARLIQLSQHLGLDVGLEGVSEDAIAEMVRATVASPIKFGELLTQLGHEVPMKPSPLHPEKLIPALAKTDEAFIALQESDNDIVAAAAETRLAIKSTLLETRIGGFLTAARLAEGRLPVPIRYAGADTTGRDSGEEYNMYNLPRVGKKPKIADALRNSLQAPPGYAVIVCDQSNIELRVNHTLWRVARSMALWADNPDADLYQAFADQIGGERQLAKVAQLGLGFGSGAVTFKRVAKTMSGGEINLDEAASLQLVTAWRAAYPEIVRGWKSCNDALELIHAGAVRAIDPWGLAVTGHECITMPGYTIRYPGLRKVEDPDKPGRSQWVYGEGRHKARIYGPKVTENIVQSLARQTICDNTIEFFKRTGLRPALRPYDELVYVVPEADAPRLLEILQDVMRTPPTWWPELRVWAKGDIGKTYGESK